MRVLMFGWEFPPIISGGLGTACHGMTKSLSQLGTDILFVLPKIPGDINAISPHLKLLGANQVEMASLETEISESEENIKTIKVDSCLHPYVNTEMYTEELHNLYSKKTDLKRMSQGLFSIGGNYGPNLYEEVDRYAKIGGYLGKSEDFDVIHAHDWMTFRAGIEAKKVSGKPLIIHVHATEFDRSGEAVNNHVFEIERLGMLEADRIIAVSHWTRKKLIERYGIDPNKIEVVHNGITKEPHITKAESGKHFHEKIVLFLGRITQQKGPEYFLEAARIVLNSIKNVRFVMAGNGDLLPQMIERMAKLRLQQHFHFTGFLSGHRREQMYAMSDLFVMPSVSEPFGLTPIEAMQYDVPVIVSKQSGVAEVLPESIKVDFWDVERLASSMIEVLTDNEVATHAIETCHNELAFIDWDRSAHKISTIYNRYAG